MTTGVTSKTKPTAFIIGRCPGVWCARFATALEAFVVLAQAIDLRRQVDDVGRELGDAGLQVGVLPL